MFRVRDSGVEVPFSVTAVIVVVTLVLALVLNGAAVYQVLEEYQLLGTWLALPGTTTDADLALLRDAVECPDYGPNDRLDAPSAVRLATLWLQRRQLAIRRTLDQVKRFAHVILASIDQGVITTDCDHVLSSINTSATRILNVEAECVGQPLSGISTVDIPLLELADRIAKRGESIRDHDCVIDHGGPLRRLHVDAHVLKDGADRTLGCVMLLRDVSERILMEERFRRMERLLSMGTLASGLHHEIKNPLTALSIHVQLLEEQLLDYAAVPPVKELISVVKSELLRLNGVLDSFRNFADLRRVNLRPTDIVGLLEEVLRLIGPQAAKQKVAVTLRRPTSALPWAPMDGEKVKQAVLNLVINALEAMPGGGHLTLCSSALHGEVRFEVADTGSGIPPRPRASYSSLTSRRTARDRHGTGPDREVNRPARGPGRIQTGPGGTTFQIAIPLESPAEVNGRP